MSEITDKLTIQEVHKRLMSSLDKFDYQKQDIPTDMKKLIDEAAINNVHVNGYFLHRFRFTEDEVKNIRKLIDEQDGK